MARFLLLLFISSTLTSTAFSYVPCEGVFLALKPCWHYLTSNSNSVNPNQYCCAGVSGIGATMNSNDGKSDLCNCLKLRVVPWLGNGQNTQSKLQQLPQKCNVNYQFPNSDPNQRCPRKK